MGRRHASKDKKTVILNDVVLGKLVHGGQALAVIEESNVSLFRASVASDSGQDNNTAGSGYVGKNIFVWGGLPGEVVNVRITKKKRSYLEGIVDSVKKPSPDRIDPVEPLSYLSTSPWQIMQFSVEDNAKQMILEESFSRENIDISWDDFKSFGGITGYRNKMEFGFWGDDEGLHLAHYVRGSHGKQKITGSILASDEINDTAIAIRDELRRLNVWGGKLKTVVIRSSSDTSTVAALFIKEDVPELSNFKLPQCLNGLDIYYSNPQSPASVPTKKLYSFGDITLLDSVMGINITYDVLSFFQVNLPVFELALKRIDDATKGSPKIDMYSGVGTIGVSISGTETLIESEESNIVMAKKNAVGKGIDVIHATSETALDYIDSEKILIVDPPRAGLHKHVVSRILDVKPVRVVYLSCNPSTQARDVAALKDVYDITCAQGYNFFPRTPHIESLIMLELKK